MRPISEGRQPHPSIRCFGLALKRNKSSWYITPMNEDDVPCGPSFFHANKSLRNNRIWKSLPLRGYYFERLIGQKFAYDEFEGMEIFTRLQSLGSPGIEKATTTLPQSGLLLCQGVIMEALRLYPVASGSGATLEKDLGVEDGAVVPKHCHAGVSFWLIHRSERWFPSPGSGV